MQRLFVLFAFVGLTSYAQTCTDLKTGTFVIESAEFGDSVLIRTATSQEEIVDKFGIHTKYDIIWTDECRYVLFNRQILKSNYKFPDGEPTDSLYIEITNITYTKEL